MKTYSELTMTRNNAFYLGKVFTLICALMCFNLTAQAAPPGSWKWWGSDKDAKFDSGSGGDTTGGTDSGTDPDSNPDSSPDPDPQPQAKAAPVGIYHSGGPSQPGRSTSISEKVNTLAHVTGTLVRIAWSDMQSGDGEFDFSLLDAELAAAAQYNSQVALVIYDGFEVPEFVKAQCESFDFLFRNEPYTTCLPWDETYQYYKNQLLQEVGSRYDSHANLASVYMTYSAMTNGAEMHWRVDEDAFTAAGYTPDRLVASYNAVMDMYAAAFATTPIVMEVHAVFRSGDLAQRGYEHCANVLGERCGVAMWWCAQRMTSNGEEDVWPVVQAASQSSFSVCQTIGNFTNQSYRFDEGQGWTPVEAIDNEMSFFRLAGITTWEIWSVDIVNDELVEVIQRIKDSLP